MCETMAPPSISDMKCDADEYIGIAVVEDPIGLGVSGVTMYHPDYMFCGECVTCAAPPPMLSTSLGSASSRPKIPGHLQRKKKQVDAPWNSDQRACLELSLATSAVAQHEQQHQQPENQDADEAEAVVRSHFKVISGLCCASEVPVIQDILRSLGKDHQNQSTPSSGASGSAIRNVIVNPATKMLIVDHIPQTINVQAIASHLTLQGFKTLPQNQQQTHTESQSSFVRSEFYIPSLNEDRAELLQTLLLDYGPLLRNISIMPASSSISLEHKHELLSAKQLATDMEKHLASFHASQTTSGHGGGIVLPTDCLVQVKHDAAANHHVSSPDVLDDEYQDQDELYTPPAVRWNVVLSGLFWIISMFSFIGPAWQSCRYAGLLAMLLGLPPVALKAWGTLRRFHFDSNCMMVIAAVGAAALGEFDEAASVSFLFSISEWLESRATLRAQRALGTICKLRPETANLLVGAAAGGQQQIIKVVPASTVQVGSLVLVRTGDKVPTDGLVLQGTSTIDESSLTGEAIPVSKQPGDVISGGTINVGSSPLTVQTTATIDDSAVSRLVKLVEESQANRSPTEQLVDAFARKYTPFVLVLATLMCTVPWFLDPDVGRQWLMNGLIVVVLACPCALTISTPVTYAAGLAATAQRGIIVKGGAHLESLGRVSHVVFDKTGTLTRGAFTLQKLVIVGHAYTKVQILRMLALMESTSSHPLASTLVKAAQDEGIDLAKDTQEISLYDHTTLEGEGISATLTLAFNNVHNSTSTLCHVGNRRLMERLGYWNKLSLKLQVELDQWSQDGATVAFLATDNCGILAAFSVMDTVREEARQVVQILRDVYHCDITMLTGDSDGAAKSIATRVGLTLPSDDDNDSESSSFDVVASQLLPHDKLRIVQTIKDEQQLQSTLSLDTRRCRRRRWCTSKKPGLVLFCGDGVNDAPAMAVADVGVAMGSGAAVAMEMSDITLMDSNLLKLIYCLELGRKVRATVKENIALSLLGKIAVVALTFWGHTTLFMAIASDVGIMLLVTLNGMKLLPNRLNKDKFSSATLYSDKYQAVLPTDMVDQGEIV